MAQRLFQLVLLIGLAAVARTQPASAEGECQEFYDWVAQHCTNVWSVGCSCVPAQGGGGEYCEGTYEGANGGEVYCS